MWLCWLWFTWPPSVLQEGSAATVATSLTNQLLTTTLVRGSAHLPSYYFLARLVFFCLRDFPFRFHFIPPQLH